MCYLKTVILDKNFRSFSHQYLPSISSHCNLQILLKFRTWKNLFFAYSERKNLIYNAEIKQNLQYMIATLVVNKLATSPNSNELPEYSLRSRQLQRNNRIVAEKFKFLKFFNRSKLI